MREQGTPFWVWDPVARDTVILDYVSSYVMSDKGNRVLALTKLKGDPDSVRLSIIDPRKKSIDIILETAGHAKSFRFDKEGDQLAFLFPMIRQRRRNSTSITGKKAAQRPKVILPAKRRVYLRAGASAISVSRVFQKTVSAFSLERRLL
ncbi:MAG: hypothetical protein U5N56_10530 [Candidatus Marinimicrobia bacterium]|nr:hypothetical protein [Candidatus Neomarinimicrobiota bacterium]